MSDKSRNVSSEAIGNAEGSFENSGEKEKLKKFFRNVIGVKLEGWVEVLAENSEICEMKAKTLLMKENDKIDEIPFLYKMGGLVKAYYEKAEGKKQIHCFAHLPGEPLVGIVNLDKQMTSFLTVELITDCEIVNVSADVIQKLSRENIEIALICNRMLSVSSMREYEYRKMILTCNPAQRYEYFLETYPGFVGKVSKKDIASYLNITPECLSRVLKKI